MTNLENTQRHHHDWIEHLAGVLAQWNVFVGLNEVVELLDYEHSSSDPNNHAYLVRIWRDGVLRTSADGVVWRVDADPDGAALVEDNNEGFAHWDCSDAIYDQESQSRMSLHYFAGKWRDLCDLTGDYLRYDRLCGKAQGTYCYPDSPHPEYQGNSSVYGYEDGSATMIAFPDRPGRHSACLQRPFGVFYALPRQGDES